MQPISKNKFDRILEHNDYVMGHFEEGTQTYYTICLQGKWLYVRVWEVEEDNFKWYRDDLSKIMASKFAQSVVNFVVVGK